MRLIRVSKLLMLVSAFTGFAVAASPQEPGPASYPLKVQILYTDIHRTKWGTTGTGKANLVGNNDVRAFEYTCDCDEPVGKTEGQELYPAKWKKEESKLRILLYPRGTSRKPSECELSVSMHNYRFGVRNDGELVPVTTEQINKFKADQRLVQSELAPDDIDPEHYPLRLSMLKLEWKWQGDFGYKGIGQGNITDGAATNAVDFDIQCPKKLRTPAPAHLFQGKWEQKGLRLTVLTHKTGEQAVFHQCDLHTTVQKGVYEELPSGTLQSISQEEFALRSKPASE